MRKPEGHGGHGVMTAGRLQSLVSDSLTVRSNLNWTASKVGMIAYKTIFLEWHFAKDPTGRSDKGGKLTTTFETITKNTGWGVLMNDWHKTCKFHILTRYGDFEGKRSKIKRQTEYTALDSILEVRHTWWTQTYISQFHFKTMGILQNSNDKVESSAARELMSHWQPGYSRSNHLRNPEYSASYEQLVRCRKSKNYWDLPGIKVIRMLTANTDHI